MSKHRSRRKPKPLKKPPARVVGGLFDGWMVKHVPVCVSGLAGRPPSRTGMRKKQRDHVLALLGYPTYAAYLASELWANIRRRVFKTRGTTCVCGCGRPATVVHHRCYSEANLTGAILKGLLPMHRDCHHEIEFENGRKSSLPRANMELKARRKTAEARAVRAAHVDEDELDRIFTAAMQKE